MTECSSAGECVSELVRVTSGDGYFSPGTRLCSQCLNDIRFHAFDVKSEDHVIQRTIRPELSSLGARDAFVLIDIAGGRHLLLPDTHLSIDKMSVHWISFLFKHLQPAPFSMLRTDGFALPHILLSGRDCCHSAATRYGLVSESRSHP